MQQTAKWTINVNRVLKKISLMVAGSFTSEEANKFIKDYQTKIGSLPNTKDFTLVLDCNELNLVKPENLNDLKNCFILYKETGFKEVIFEVEKGELFLKMQLNRLGRETGLNNIKVVEK